MKYLATFILFLFFTNCATYKKVEFVFMPNMKPDVKAEMLRQAKLGYIHFKVSCAECHTKKTLFGTKIYDFTSEQIYNYELRRSNKVHENTLTTDKVTTEEIGYILSFLSYKKNSGLPHKSTH